MRPWSERFLWTTREVEWGHPASGRRMGDYSMARLVKQVVNQDPGGAGC